VSSGIISERNYKFSSVISMLVLQMSDHGVEVMRRLLTDAEGSIGAGHAGEAD
jgi:hypothetical protein